MVIAIDEAQVGTEEKENDKNEQASEIITNSNACIQKSGRPTMDSPNPSWGEGGPRSPKVQPYPRY